MQDTCMAPGCTSDPHGLVRRQWLCNQLSTRREPGDQIPHSVLPPAEMGTAQQENPVAQLVGTTHTFQFTTEELHVLHQAMHALINACERDDQDPYDQGPQEWWSLRETIGEPLRFEEQSKSLQQTVDFWKRECNLVKDKLQKISISVVNN